MNAYVIDTGIRQSHSQFGGRAVHGYSAISDGRGSDDCNGHGTHVAGTIGSSTYGVAKSVRLYAVRVLACNGSGTNAGVIAGVDWVTDNHVKPAVANMSLGGGASSALDAAVNDSIAAGVSYAVAAGNDNRSACNWRATRGPLQRPFATRSWTRPRPACSRHIGSGSPNRLLYAPLSGGGTTPPPPTGCTLPESYSGSLSGAGDYDYQPNGNYFYTSRSGTHRGCLSGPSGSDFDLYLQKWNGSSWVNVAQGIGSTSTEDVSYNGTSGYYVWRIVSYSGSGSYTLNMQRP